MFLLVAHHIRPVRLVHDGLIYYVKIIPAVKRPLEIWRGNKEIAFGLLTKYHPWCLQVADVDGFGQVVAVGVSKPTHNLHFEHRTLFLISFDGHSLKRKWTASTMGRPLLEFCFAPKTPQRLFTLETTLDKHVALSGYKWVSFGFQKIGHEYVWKTAKNLIPNSAGISLTADGHQVLLPWSNLFS